MDRVRYTYGNGSNSSRTWKEDAVAAANSVNQGEFYTYDANGSQDETLYAIQDSNWNTMALADTSGAVIERFDYTPYGQSTVLDTNFAPDSDAISDVDWEYRFTSREFDGETSLHYFRARYYHDGLGRFIGRDPLGFVDGFNVYAAYFSSRGVDPTGTTCLTARVACTKRCNAIDKYVYGLGGCHEECDTTYAYCMADERLENQLNSCCEQARAAGKRSCRSDCPDPPAASCSSEASDVTKAMGNARQIINDRGGPSWFSYFGPNCEQTQLIPVAELEKIASPCDTIGYEQVGYDNTIIVGSHNWLELKCGDKVITVDFWKGGVKDYWRSGRNAYGVCANY